MDIEKLKAEFEQSKCFKKLEHVAQYTFFEFGAYLRRTDVPDDVEKKCGHLITALIFSWRAWEEAKAQAVPEWFDYTKQSPQMDGNYQIFIKGEQITAKWVSRFGFADPIEGDALRQELITHWAMQPQPPKAQEPADD